MKYEITPSNIEDVEKIKLALEEWMKYTKEEWEKQSERAKLHMVFEQDVSEVDGKVYYRNTIGVPIKFALKRALESKLRSFLKDKGVETQVKFLGD